MTPEDEEFQRISREIKRRSEEDDDIQEYKKPWVGLTEEEQLDIFSESIAKQRSEFENYKAIENALRNKNAWTPFTKTLWRPFTLIFGQHQE